MVLTRLRSGAARLWRGDPARAEADLLYARAGELARRLGFYTQLGVADEMGGRFEMLVLHLVLLMRRLQAGGERDAARALSEAMTRDLDAVYREMGYGDAKVARRVRGAAEDLAGRALAYARGLEAPGDALALALGRNVYDDETAPGAWRLAAWAREADAALAALPLSEVRAARFDLPDPEASTSQGPGPGGPDPGGASHAS